MPTNGNATGSDANDENEIHDLNFEPFQQPSDPEHSTSKEAGLNALISRTQYPLIQQNGQRRYGPPPDWEGAPPPKGCEVFIGKLPRDAAEDELVPVFEKVGKIYEMRLMMDFCGGNRGYAFVMYTNQKDAKRACQELNGYEIRTGRFIGVLKSVDNCRLYISGIPRERTKEELKVEISRLTDGVVDVILYPSASDKNKNRGFAFIEYNSHRSAAMARRKLIPGKTMLYGNEVTVDWAEPERDVDEETMAHVGVVTSIHPLP
ncbi:unnamed protein product [Soboliphyme baturini]|uniref:APOBEC1 complementation factor n=1 Tax=Soboliphyme baturini TaxID=241478 RepID=A0A183IM06_9BILA|nr:unnamed protein product [Soboliphyme baturini]